jgi:hypothetical protein
LTLGAGLNLANRDNSGTTKNFAQKGPSSATYTDTDNITTGTTTNLLTSSSSATLYNIKSAYEELQTITINCTTGDLKDHVPVFVLAVLQYPNNATFGQSELNIESIEIKDLSYKEKDFINGEEAEYIKLADDLEDNATYKVTINYTSEINTTLKFFTANAENNIHSNAVFLENVFPVAVNSTVTSHYYYFTADLVNGQGDSLYVYAETFDGITGLDSISVEKVSAVTNGGVSKLEEQQVVNNIQALRYYFKYETKTGSEIVIDGVEYEIVKRGFLLADATNTVKYATDDEKAVTLATANGSTIRNFSTSGDALLNCWEAVVKGDLTELTFSTYVTGFKPEQNGGDNESNRLFVKGYVVIEVNGVETVLYGKESALTVKDVTDLHNVHITTN